jgi:uncharacterized repeat protein (TIGR03837 family)
MQFQNIDIFCHVVDNFGDIGVAYRFAREFRLANPWCRTRLFVDDLNALKEIAPNINQSRQNGDVGIEILDASVLSNDALHRLDLADILVETFACHMPEPILQAAQLRPRVIINLEHLSAEAWVEGYHLKESLLPYANVKKYYFMPGLTAATGGIILSPCVERIKPRLAAGRFRFLQRLLSGTGIRVDPEERVIIGTVFTYQRGFDRLLSSLRTHAESSLLLVFGCKSRESMTASLNRIGGSKVEGNHYRAGNAQILFIPFLPQERYDALLCCADFNIVRGEDSFVRAILAGKPMLWNAYLQNEKYHKVKVAAFLETIEQYFDDAQAFQRYRELHLTFNDAAVEGLDQITHERYEFFFDDLPAIERAIRTMSGFLTRECSLIEKFSAFLESLP